jgi:hypothetical protein
MKLLPNKRNEELVFHEQFFCHAERSESICILIKNSFLLAYSDAFAALSMTNETSREYRGKAKAEIVKKNAKILRGLLHLKQRLITQAARSRLQWFRHDIVMKIPSVRKPPLAMVVDLLIK